MIRINKSMRKAGYIALIWLMALCCLASCGSKEVPETMNDTNTGILFYELSVQDAKTVNPNAYNLHMAIEKGLAKQEIYDGNYLKLQAAYLAVADHYLCEKAGLNGYQAFLDAHDYNFAAPNANVYIQAGAFGRTNIYIRNNAYVERLSLADLQLLEEAIQGQRVLVTDMVLEMVERTLLEVITLRYDDSTEVFEAVYNAGALQTNFAPSNALVFGISYEPDFDADGNLVDRATEEKKLEFIGAFADMMAAEMEEKLDISVRVFID